MYAFIHYIRAIATVLITNSHYGEIWPISAMAAGGMLGNVLFFAASGFCLFKIKESFGKWYLKRFMRVYPVMILFTLLTILGGGYALHSWQDAVRLFVFPTNYVFLVWLMLAYVAFYWVAWFSKKYERFTELTLAGKMFVDPVNTEFSKMDIFLPEQERIVKQICEYMMNQQPKLTKYSAFSGYFNFNDTVVGDIFRRFGHKHLIELNEAF